MPFKQALTIGSMLIVTTSLWLLNVAEHIPETLSALHTSHMEIDSSQSLLILMLVYFLLPILTFIPCFIPLVFSFLFKNKLWLLWTTFILLLDGRAGLELVHFPIGMASADCIYLIYQWFGDCEKNEQITVKQYAFSLVICCLIVSTLSIHPKKSLRLSYNDAVMCSWINQHTELDSDVIEDGTPPR